MRCVAGGGGSHAMERVICGIYGYTWPGTSSSETSGAWVSEYLRYAEHIYSLWPHWSIAVSLVTRGEGSTG